MVFRNHYLGNLKLDLQSELPSYSLLVEDIATFPVTLLLPRFVPYTEVFKEKIDELIASGLVKLWSDQMFLIDKLNNVPEEIEPQILTLEHLFDGFIAFVACLILSFACFVFELLVKLLSDR
jgi:hypothetical protein